MSVFTVLDAVFVEEDAKAKPTPLRNGNALITASHVSTTNIDEVTLLREVIRRVSLPIPAEICRADLLPSLYPLRGEADDDDDLDLLDFASFQDCFRGADGFAIHRNCLMHDYDQDGDIDLDDFRRSLPRSSATGTDPRRVAVRLLSAVTQDRPILAGTPVGMLLMLTVGC